MTAIIEQSRKFVNYFAHDGMYRLGGVKVDRATRRCYAGGGDIVEVSRARAAAIIRQWRGHRYFQITVTACTGEFAFRFVGTRRAKKEKGFQETHFQRDIPRRHGTGRHIPNFSYHPSSDTARCPDAGDYA